MFLTMALLLTVNCVRNTVIEDYHAGGKLSDKEMMEFNKEVANKVFTFLNYYLNYQSQLDKIAFAKSMLLYYPTNWDKPKLDESMIRGVEMCKKDENFTA